MHKKRKIFKSARKNIYFAMERTVLTEQIIIAIAKQKIARTDVDEPCSRAIARRKKLVVIEAQQKST